MEIQEHYQKQTKLLVIKSTQSCKRSVWSTSVYRWCTISSKYEIPRQDQKSTFYCIFLETESEVGTLSFTKGHLDIWNMTCGPYKIISLKFKSAIDLLSFEAYLWLPETKWFIWSSTVHGSVIPHLCHGPCSSLRISYLEPLEQNWTLSSQLDSVVM